MLGYAFTMSWIGVWMGLRLPSVEVAQQVSFMVILPLTFVSNVFVPVQSLPDWLQPIATSRRRRPPRCRDRSAGAGGSA